MNKGKRLIHCKECKRRRYCLRVSIPNHNFRWTCSKGHTWIIKGVTLDRINSVMEVIFLSRVKNLFERDDTFFREMKRK